MKTTLGLIVLLGIAIATYFYVEQRASQEDFSNNEYIQYDDQGNPWVEGDPVVSEQAILDEITYQEEAEVDAESRLNELDSLDF